MRDMIAQIKCSFLEVRTGIEHYMLSTHCGYFSSSHSKRYLATASILLSKISKTTMKVVFEISEARTGIEPVHVGFADRSVTTSPPGQITHVLR